MNLLRRGRILMVTEGLDVCRVNVPAALVNKRIADSSIRERTGCNVVAIRTAGGKRVVPGPEELLRDDAQLVLIGSVEAEEEIVVGVNRYTEGEGARPPLLKVDEQLQRKRAERLQALRARRDRGRVEQRIQAVVEAARSDANLVPPILDAVEADVTLGEIADSLRSVFGVYRQPSAF